MAKRFNLLRFTPGSGANPLFSEARDGTIPVYWTAGQGLTFEEPPSYFPPPDYPPAALTLFRRPRVVRLVTDTGSGGGGTTGTQKTRTFHSTQTELTDGNTEVGPFCSCDATVVVHDVPGSPHTVAVSSLNVATMNAFWSPDSPYDSSADATGGSCSCEGGGPSTDENEVYREAFPSLSFPTRCGSLVFGAETLSDYLSASSVNDAHVPAGMTTNPFIGGQALTIYLFATDDMESEYDPLTFAASDVGVRIAAAYPAFRKYRVVLAANLAGDIGPAFKTKLSALADVMADFGFVYREFAGADPVADLQAEVDDFFTP